MCPVPKFNRNLTYSVREINLCEVLKMTQYSAKQADFSSLYDFVYSSGEIKFELNFRIKAIKYRSNRYSNCLAQKGLKIHEIKKTKIVKCKKI